MGIAVKYIDIVDRLREEIRAGRYGSRGAFPSETQLLRRFGTSRQTVVRALDVLRKEGLIIRHKGAGTFLSAAGKRATGRIGLIVHGSDYCEIFAPIAKRISVLCQERGYSLLFGDVSSQCTAKRIRKVVDLADRFVEEGVDGVIFQPIELVPNAVEVNREVMTRFDRAGVPVALLDSDIVPGPERSGYDLVSVNHFEVGRRLATHLRAVGARRVVYLTQRDRAPCVQARQLGVKTGCEGMEVPGTAFVGEPEDEKAIRRLLKRYRPDAIACYNDRQAALLMQTLSKVGRRVPEDVMVAGFDDVQVAKLTVPQLTTMHQPCDEIATATIGLLMDRIRNQAIPPRAVVIDAPLVVRKSTLNLRN